MITKDDFKSTQPILYQILEKSFKSGNIPHAFLLVGYNNYDAAHFIAKSLICDQDLLCCSKCPDCNKIEKHSYSDFIFFSGKKESIKKQNIDYIQTQFSKSALEGKNQIYMLENIENSSVEAMNSLLKTLEEPRSGVYAILTCVNLNKVLPTIQSRCQVIQLLPETTGILKKQLLEKGISDENGDIMVNIFHSYQECEPYIDSDTFIYIKEEVKYFVEDMYLHKDNLLINVQTHLLKDYKDKESIVLFLNMLVLALRDLFHVKHSMNYIFKSFKNIYDVINVNDDIIIFDIDVILETEYLLSTNANILLLIDSMIYKIQKGVS